MRLIYAILFLLMTAYSAWAEESHPDVRYNFTETRRTDSDYRDCNTQIFLIGNTYAGVYYRESVFGATTPTVTSVTFNTAHQPGVTLEEQNELAQALIAAHVFDLTSEPKPASTDYWGWLKVHIGKQETDLVFYSPPNSPQRKAIHDIMLQFAKRMKIDRPENIEEATTVTEGDLQPARRVELADVLAHPEQYNGKRVSVVGFYHGEFEGSTLAIDRAAALKNDFTRSVWRSEPSSFADKSAIKDRNNSWQRVEGVFLRGPGGHMGLWPGEIARITRIEPVPKP